MATSWSHLDQAFLARRLKACPILALAEGTLRLATSNDEIEPDSPVSIWCVVSSDPLNLLAFRAVFRSSRPWQVASVRSFVCGPVGEIVQLLGRFAALDLFQF